MQKQIEMLNWFQYLQGFHSNLCLGALFNKRIESAHQDLCGNVPVMMKQSMRNTLSDFKNCYHWNLTWNTRKLLEESLDCTVFNILLNRSAILVLNMELHVKGLSCKRKSKSR